MFNKLIYYINIIRKKENRIKFLTSQILKKTGLCRFFIIDRGPYKIKFFPTNLSAAYWFNKGVRDADEAFFENYLKTGDFVIDVGANIGTLTLNAASIVGSEGKVVSFEPHPRIYTFLIENVSLNKFNNIDTYMIALSNKPGNTFLSNYTADDQNKILPSGKIPVKIETLDNIMSKYHSETISLLKVDVEGYEKYILEGGVETLKKTLLIYFESYEKHFKAYGYSSQDLFKLLERYGFILFKCNAGGIKKVERYYCSSDCENLLALRDIKAFLKRTNYVIQGTL